MVVSLRVSERHLKPVTAALQERGHLVDQEGSLLIIEVGLPVPENHMTLVFRMERLDLLLQQLDLLSPNIPVNLLGKSSDGTIHRIVASCVMYIEAVGNDVYAVLPEGLFRLKERLYELELSLPDSLFVRTGKSQLVNITQVDQIIPWIGRRLLLRFKNSKREVEVSKAHVAVFKQFLERE